jgi:hypothetical protein
MSETVNDTMGSCPICALRVPIVPRYPRALCARCSGESADETGRRLEFFNTSISGGFEARYQDTGETRNGHTCYVRGKRCYADEARFGGIVVELADFLPNRVPVTD